MALYDRRKSLLTENIDALRRAFTKVKTAHPFHIVAIVVLPEHLHYNPVKHGLVERVVDWPHSTFFNYVERGIYPLSWGTEYRGKMAVIGE